jgi:hypothetical protein
MSASDQRAAEDRVHAAVDQLLHDPDPITAIRQVTELADQAIPYLRAAKRAAVYRAKMTGMSWTALSEQLLIRESNVRAIVARHCRDTGDPWPPRRPITRPPRARDLRGVE